MCLNVWTNAHVSEEAEDNCLWRWIETTTDLAKCTSRQTCKRNFSQNHASGVTEQTENLVFIHIHLVEPARVTSHRIIPAQLLNRGSSLHPYTSRRTCKRNFKQTSYQHSYWTDGGSLFIHVHLVEPARGTSHRIIPAQLLNRRRISFHPCTSRRTCKRNFKQTSYQHSYWTDGGSLFIHVHLIGPARGTSNGHHTSTATEQTEDLVFNHIHLIGPARGTSHRILPAQRILNRRRISSSSISQEWTPFYIKCLMLTFIWYNYKFN